MAKGDSGRIVLEVDPTLKKQLYSILALEQKTLKDWFIQQAEQHIKIKKDDLIKSIEQEHNEI
ncbi:hypothetical protein [Moritella viscosa]|uniref:Uncharacterized protein n=1 Tax=Moritella viscosa TaxID=80854 RepID=A0ABY1HH41_9GAMM|nr:hypothetical protein [Moritella viscosa]SGY93122.1 Putative uncharacterized protein [Moritella viscosa]SHO26599.1 Putative uncharacterized protein [Moritella viscosa]